MCITNLSDHLHNINLCKVDVFFLKATIVIHMIQRDKYQYYTFITQSYENQNEAIPPKIGWYPMMWSPSP